MVTSQFGHTGSMDLIKDSWQEQAAFLWCMERENLHANGFLYSRPESADFEAAEAAFDNLSDGLKDWIDAALAAYTANEEIPALDDEYIPELLQFIALLLTGDWGAIFILFVKVGLKFLIRLIKERVPSISGVVEGDASGELHLHLHDSRGVEEGEMAWNVYQ